MPASNPGFDWFTRLEIRRVLVGLAKAEIDSVVLIGGQSIAFWALYYKIELPRTDTPALTQDIDFKGTSKQAKSLAASIKASIKTPTLDDATASTGFLVWEPAQAANAAPRRLMIDFLGSVLGVRDKDVVDLAVNVQIEDFPPIRVMHPLVCMESRFANLAMLSGKRDSNGIAQARIGVEIAKNFISTDAAAKGHAVVARAITRVVEACTSPSGIYVFNEFGIDGMDAVGLSLLPPDHPFVEKSYSKLLEKLVSKREIDSARREGRVHEPKATRNLVHGRPFD